MALIPQQPKVLPSTAKYSQKTPNKKTPNPNPTAAPRSQGTAWTRGWQKAPRAALGAAAEAPLTGELGCVRWAVQPLGTRTGVPPQTPSVPSNGRSGGLPEVLGALRVSDPRERGRAAGAARALALGLQTKAAGALRGG